jgi:hypothetical protein
VLTTLLPSVSRLSRQCEILSISQPYGLPRPNTRIAILSFCSFILLQQVENCPEGIWKHSAEQSKRSSCPCALHIVCHTIKSEILRSLSARKVLYITLTINILDIIHGSVLYLKHNVSETGFCLLLQVEPSQLSPIDRASLSLDLRQRLALSIRPNWVGSIWRQRENAGSETLCFK